MSCAVLPPGAAHRSATRRPATSPSKPRRQRRRGILHPPRAFGEAGQCSDCAVRDGAHRAGRQHAAAELRRQTFGIAFDRQIERGLFAIGGGDSAGGGLAVSPGPARQQPFRGIERDRIERGETLGAFAGHTPQHGIDQTGEMNGVAVGPRQPHRKIDGGVVGHIEEQDLRCADQQHDLDPSRLRGQPAFEKQPDQMAQRAEPAQRGRDQRAGERPIAVGKAGKPGIGAGAVELLIERAMLPQHGVENVGGNAPGGETGYVVAAGRSGRVPARMFHLRIASLRQPLVDLARLRQVTGDANRSDTAKACRRQHCRQSGAGKLPLTPAAERALAEAAARRAERDRIAAERAKEIRPRKSRAATDPSRPVTAIGK